MGYVALIWVSISLFFSGGGIEDNDQITKMMVYSIPRTVDYRGFVDRDRLMMESDKKICTIEDQKFFSKFTKALEKTTLKKTIKNISEIGFTSICDIHYKSGKVLSVNMDLYNRVKVEGMIFKDCQGLLGMLDSYCQQDSYQGNGSLKSLIKQSRKKRNTTK